MLDHCIQIASLGVQCGCAGEDEAADLLWTRLCMYIGHYQELWAIWLGMLSSDDLDAACGVACEWVYAIVDWACVFGSTRELYRCSVRYDKIY